MQYAVFDLKIFRTILLCERSIVTLGSKGVFRKPESEKLCIVLWRKWVYIVVKNTVHVTSISSRTGWVGDKFNHFLYLLCTTLLHYYSLPALLCILQYIWWWEMVSGHFLWCPPQLNHFLQRITYAMQTGHAINMKYMENCQWLDINENECNFQVFKSNGSTM